MNGSRNTIEASGLHVLRPQPFQNMLTSSDIIRFGTRLNLLTETHIGTRLHPNNINRDSGIEIPEGWMPTIKQHSSRSVPQRTCEGTASSQNNEDRNPPIINNHNEDRNAPITNSHVLLIMRHSQSTSSPDEDQQEAVETSRSTPM